MSWKGILLAGGSGTRLYPITQGVSKQLLPIYDKPMIYYPLTTLMQAGLRDIAVITTPQYLGQFRRLLGDGRAFGIKLTYIVQARPDGLAQAYSLAQVFLDGASSIMALGDNIFLSTALPAQLRQAMARPGATVFGHTVPDPHRFGVLDISASGAVRGIVEKPSAPPSDKAVTGLYVMDRSAPLRSETLRPSPRGELEITDLLNTYLADGRLTADTLGPGAAWFDTGTHDALLSAGQFVQALHIHQGQLIGSPEAAAFDNGWITADQLARRACNYAKTSYGQALQRQAECPGRLNPVIPAIPVHKGA